MEETKRINGEELTLEQAYIKHHRLIYRVANKLKSRGKETGFELDELVSAGKIGFIQAYERFDSDLGLRFSSFAHPYIFGHIMMEIKRKDIGLTISTGVKERAVEVLKENVSFEELTVTKVMEILGVNYKYAFEVYYFIRDRNPKSIEEKIRRTEKTAAGDDLLSVGDTFKVDDDLSTLVVYENRKLLTEKERVVYDLMAQGYTQTDIQEITGLKRTTINMRVMKIKYKLSHVLEDYRRNG